MKLNENKLRVLIVDDEPLARDLLAAILMDDEGVEVLAKCSDGEAAIDFALRELPNLIFLDIEMPEINGLEIAATLIEKMGVERMPQIIFATAYDHYAIEAFRVNALDYVLKPLADHDIQKCLERVRRTLRLSQGEAKTIQLRDITQLGNISLRDGDKIILIPPENLIRIEAQGDYVALHLNTGTRFIRSTMKSIQATLPSDAFQRVHRSSIINLQAVREVTPGAKGAAVAVLIDGTRVVVSRAYRTILRERLNA